MSNPTPSSTKRPSRPRSPGAEASSALSSAQATVSRLRTRLAFAQSMTRTKSRSLVRISAHYRELLKKSRRVEEQSRRLARRLLTVQEEERKSISRDLHDEIAQTLAAINVQLASLKQASALDNLELGRRILTTQKLIGHSVTIVRRYARELRPAMLDDIGLMPTLRAYIRELPGKGQLNVILRAAEAAQELPQSRRIVIYRVVQEALLNIARHARATHAVVRMVHSPKAVALTIHDNGCSFAVEDFLNARHAKHLGLLGMRERVEMIGGKFSVSSKAGDGTTISAIIPLGSRPRKEKS